jgi:hypothetical protein
MFVKGQQQFADGFFAIEVFMPLSLFCDLGSLGANNFVFYELRIGLPEDYFTLCLQRDSMESVVDVVS